MPHPRKAAAIQLLINANQEDLADRLRDDEVSLKEAAEALTQLRRTDGRGCSGAAILAEQKLWGWSAE